MSNNAIFSSFYDENEQEDKINVIRKKLNNSNLEKYLMNKSTKTIIADSKKLLLNDKEINKKIRTILFGAGTALMLTLEKMQKDKQTIDLTSLTLMLAGIIIKLEKEKAIKILRE